LIVEQGSNKGENMNTYTLTAKGKEFAKTAKPTTHSGAVVAAVKKFKKGATSAQIIEAVTAMKIPSKMDVRKAVSFMLFDLSKRRGVLAAKSA
jgi:hypothetical protein